MVIQTLKIRRMKFLVLLKNIRQLFSPSELWTANPSPHKGHLPEGRKCLVCATFYSSDPRDLILHILPLVTLLLSENKRKILTNIITRLIIMQNSANCLEEISLFKNKDLPLPELLITI